MEFEAHGPALYDAESASEAGGSVAPPGPSSAPAAGGKVKSQISLHPRMMRGDFGGNVYADPEEAPPVQVFEGKGDVASALAEYQRAQKMISANGLEAYEAADEGTKAAAFAAAKDAKRQAQREFALDRARTVAAKMEATAQLDPADALPFGFVAKLRDGHDTAVTYCTWADDAQHIASCDTSGKVCVWDTHTCTVRREYIGHTGAVSQVRLFSYFFSQACCAVPWAKATSLPPPSHNAHATHARAFTVLAPPPSRPAPPTPHWHTGF